MQGYKTVRVIRSLDQAVPKDTRPECARCRKRLSPLAQLLYAGEEDPGVPPDDSALPWMKDGKAMSYKLVLGVYREEFNFKDDVHFYAHVWLGTFKGYSPNRETTPVFCTRDCAAKFGYMAYKAGFRRV